MSNGQTRATEKRRCKLPVEKAEGLMSYVLSSHVKGDVVVVVVLLLLLFLHIQSHPDLSTQYPLLSVPINTMVQPQ